MDVNGFKFVKHKSALTPEDLYESDKHPEYTREIEELLKKEYIFHPPPFPAPKRALAALGLFLRPSTRIC